MKNDQKIYCLIGARSNSKSISNKNILTLGNHPLIAYSIVAAKLSLYIKDVVVSTDSERIAAIAKKYSASVPFLRPLELAQDNSTDIEFFKHYLDYLKQESLKIPDLIVHLRPTTPLRDVKEIDSAIKYMLENKEATALRSMYKTCLTPYKMFKVKDGYACPFLAYKDIKEFYNLPRQTFEDAYIPNGYVDIVKPEILASTGLLHGEKMKIWETEVVPDIDEIKDYNLAAELLTDKRFEQILKKLEEYNG